MVKGERYIILFISCIAGFTNITNAMQQQPLWAPFDWVTVGPNEPYTLQDREINLNEIVEVLSKTQQKVQSLAIDTSLKDPICINLNFYIARGKELQEKRAAMGSGAGRRAILDAFIRSFWRKEKDLQKAVEALEKKLQEYYSSQNQIAALEQQAQNLAAAQVDPASIDALSVQMGSLQIQIASQKQHQDALANDLTALVGALQSLTIAS